MCTNERKTKTDQRRYGNRTIKFQLFKSGTRQKVGNRYLVTKNFERKSYRESLELIFNNHQEWFSPDGCTQPSDK